MRKRRFTGFRENFRMWWHAPVTGKDRALGMFAGAIGFFWIALILLALLRVHDIGSLALGVYIAGMMVLGTLLGERFPKPVSAICYPFLTFN